MIFSLTVNVSAASVSDFNDVSQSSWYYSSVKFVTDKGYMNGTSATTFSPSDRMTRAMFVTVLSREANASTDNTVASSFSDVKSGQWYTGAVEWAHSNGIVTGYSDTVFGIDDPVTRQDIAVLVDRYVKFMNYTLKEKPQVDSFTDAASISDYAKSAVEACRLAGLYYGNPDGTLRPMEYVTRAEVAAIIERLEKITGTAAQDAPVISPNGGSFSGTQKVTLSTDIEGAVIYYTTDGSDPTVSSTLYTGPFTLNDSATVKAAAAVDGEIVSEIASASFTKVSSSGGSGGGTSVTYTVPVYDASGELIGSYVGSAVTAEKAAEKLSLGTPTKDPTVDKNYTFAGWAWFDADGNQITNIGKAAALKPVFTESVRKYTITWKNDDGEVLFTSECEYGAVPSYSRTENPKSAINDGITRVWIGWDPEPSKVTGDATYIAKYEEVTKKIEVIWYDTDGTELYRSTINLGEDAPAYEGDTPSKLGYLFMGWEISKDLDGNIIYTAVYTPAAMDYNVKVSFGKGSNIGDIIAIDDSGSEAYHVTFDESGNIVSDSDDISLVQIAKDLCDEENIEALLGKVKNISITDKGTEKFVIKDGVIQEVVIQTIKVAAIITQGSEDTAAIVNKINTAITEEGLKIHNKDGDLLESITEENVINVIDALDGGITEETQLSTEEQEIAGALADKLEEKIQEDPEQFEEKLKDKLQEYLGFDTINDVDNFLSNLGISEENNVTLTTFAQEYIEKLRGLLPDSQMLSLKSNEESSTESGTTTQNGVEIKVNPVTVLIQQYGTSEDSYAAAWNLIAEYIGEERRDELKNSYPGQKLIAACNPAKFFDKTTDSAGKAVYSLKEASEYDSLLCDIIDKAEAVRQDLIVGKSQSEIEDLIRNTAEKVDNKLGSSFSGSLTDARVAEIAELMGMAAPKLTDITGVKESGLSKTEYISVGESGADIDINNIVDTIMNAIGVSKENFDKAQDLIDGITNKLSGSYTISVEISASPCDEESTH